MRKSYNHLNLQQKLLKIGKHIPDIPKAHLNGDEEYEFATLDDLNAYLKPALNRYGVNFSILEECATQKNEHGDPIFVREINDGWVYESDLTVAWINVDRPEEMEKTVIHLIGTNVLPEKAKGSAMTYGIKYYLFRKFNISLRDKEDPDFSGNTVEDVAKEPVRNTPGEEQGKHCEAKKNAERAANEILARKEAQEKTRTENSKVTPISSAKVNIAQQAKAAVERVSSRKEDAGEDKGKLAEQTAKESKAEEKRAEDLPKGFQEARAEDAVPFEEDEFMRAIMNGIEQERIAMESENVAEMPENMTGFDETAESAEEGKSEESDEEPVVEEKGMTVEEAKKVICKMGNFLGRPFEDVLNDSEKGRKMLVWIMNRYKGDDETQVMAARTLLPVYDNIHGTAA